MKHSCCSPRVRVSLDRSRCYNSVSLKLEGTAKPRDCLPVSLPQAASPSSAYMPPAGRLSNPVSNNSKRSAACLSEQIKGPDLTWVLLFPPSCIFGKGRFGFQAGEGLNRLSSTRLKYKLQIAVPGWKSVTKQLCHAGEHPRAWLPLPWFSPLPPGAQD